VFHAGNGEPGLKRFNENIDHNFFRCLPVEHQLFSEVAELPVKQFIYFFQRFFLPLQEPV
jgi:hypothetical protein